MNMGNTQVMNARSYPLMGSNLQTTNLADRVDKPVAFAVLSPAGVVSATNALPSSSLAAKPVIVDPTPEQSKAMVEKVNSVLKQSDTELQFQFDKDAGKMVLYLKDAKTGETLRQIPGEAALRISKDIDTYLSGLKSHQNAKDAVGQLSGLITDTKA
jgi:uncharacterized FlaG/YvyC family protein